MTNIWKRSLSLFLALVMVFGMLPVNALAAEIVPETTEITSETEAVMPMAETPVETTEAPPATTEAPTEGTTAPFEEAEETTAPSEETEAVTVPAEETTAPSEAPEETTAPVEETVEATEPSEETTPEETEAEETVPEETEAVATKESHTSVPSMALPSDEDLFEGYAENVFYGNGPAILGTAAGETLSGDVKLAYDALVPVIQKIASGDRASTTVTLGYDLGYVAFEDGTSGTYDAEVDVAFAGTTFDQEDLDSLLAALLADLPYDLYWFDKVTGLVDVSVAANSMMHITFQFTVAPNYRGADAYTANTTKTGAAEKAFEVATDVVYQVFGDSTVETEYDVLAAYKDWICENTAYNKAAAEGGDASFVTDNDPWQLIYVFDEDPSTTVVCEGYSKAFQYLCDLTMDVGWEFESYSVTGNFKSGDVDGPHMWNIVKLDGAYYLVDVTNSEDNSVGYDGSLFLAGGTPNADGSYSFVNCDGVVSTYSFDDTTKELWADTGVLNLAASDYESANADTGTETTTGMTQAKLEEELAAAKAAGTYYTLSESFTLEENMTIDQTTDDGYVYPVIIASGVTLTVPSGVKLTLRGGMQISGTLVIEDGATLAVGDSSMWGNISMDGGKLVIGSTAKLTFGQYGVIYADPTVQNGITGTVPAGYLYGQYVASTEAELLEALADTEYSGNTISGHDIYVHDDITLTKNLTIGVNDSIMAQNGCTLTVNSGVTVTNNGGISVYQATLNNNGTIANSGWIGGEGWYTGTGKITGDAHQIQEIVRTTMTQDEFVAALESSGGWYTLSSDVVITEDYATPEDYGFWIDSLGSLTIAEGVTFTANGQLSTGVAPITINGTLVSNVHMSVDGSGNKGGITVSETGTLVNNSQLLVASGSLTINGTYSADSTGWVSWDNTNSVIVGEEKIGKENIEIQIIADTEEELIAGMVVQEGYRGNVVYTNANITLNSSLEIPEGIRFTVGYSWREDGPQYQYGLTLADGVTLTNNGNLYVNTRMYLTVGEGAALVNNGFVWVDGKLESYGTIQGNDLEGNGTILIHASAMSQADFAAAVAEAAAAGEVYSLTNRVTLTEDMTIACYVEIEEGASLTVADGAHLTVQNYADGTFAQIAIDGEMTVESGAELTIIHNSLVHAYFGDLIVEDGATIKVVEDGVTYEGANDHIWFNQTEGGTVTGVPNAQLGIEFYPETAAQLESALATTGYARIHVYFKTDVTLDSNITIPNYASVDVSEESTLKVADGYTLTNNGDINIQNNNRLEILKGATIVNNGTINVDQYAQFVVRGEIENNGNVYGEITYGGMTHEELMEVIAECEANGHGWVHESETTLEPNVNDGVLSIAMGEGDPSPEFYLDDGGIIRVPSGTRLEVYNPLVLIGGQIIVEEGGTLYVGGVLAIQEGTVYIEQGGTLDVDENAMGVKGKITWEGETDTYLSGRWLEDWGEGWFENTDAVPDENAGLGVSAMTDNFVIFYLKTWDSENLRWISTPVVPTEASEYLTFTRMQDTDMYIKPGEANAEYFVKVEARGVLDHTELYIFVDGVAYPYSIWQRDLAFYTDSYAGMDTIIVGHDFILNTDEGAENSLYLILNNEGRIVNDITFNINTWGEDYNALVSDGNFLDQEELVEGKVWKFTVDPEYTDYIQYDWKNFEISYVAQIADPDGSNAYHTGDGMWVHAPDLLEPEAVFYINGNDYLIYDTGAVFRNYPTEDYDEWGNQIWARERTELPAGVSYDWTTNTMTLENASLELLSVGYDGSWTDDEGNYVENYRMPSADFTLDLVGSNTITCDNDAALAIWGGANVTITGDGSLHMKAVNSPDNVNDQGQRYAYQTVNIRDGGSLTITGNADVTAEIAGSGFHGDIPAQMTAICGDNNETLTVSGNAELTIVMPDMRTIDESQENYPGARGLTNISIVVNDNATLNADSIYLWDGVDFTQNGGTVNLNPLGEVFWNERLGGYMLSHLGVYMEEADSVFTMNGGTMNINVDDVEEGYVLNIFQAINVSHGEVVINGGELNINGAQDGTAIALQCAMDENGPIAGLPTGNLTMTGGTINIKGTEGWMYEGIYVSPLSQVELKGGIINADYSDSFLEGNVTWDGTEFNGTVAAIRTYGPGEFTMESGEINLTGAEYEFDGETIQGNAAFEANGSGKILGGSINITNGVFRNNMNIGIEGGEITINNDWAELPGIENNLYLPIVGGTVDVTANGVAIRNNGTFHQMGGYVKVTNTDSDNDNSDVPSIHSIGSLLINDGTMDVTGGYYGIIQNYNFDLAADEEAGNESVLFVGAMEDGQVPTLNIRNTKMGVYASAPVDFQWNANVNIEAEGTPANNGRDWPTALFIDRVTAEGSSENVASLTIGGGAKVDLTSQDTAGVDAMSKGIVAWYAPVTIQGCTDDNGEYWAPNVTIDAEMAVYSMSDSAENDNFSDNVMFKSIDSGMYVPMTAQAFGDGYIHSLLENGEYVGRVEIGEKAYTDLDAFIAGMQAANAAGVAYELKQSLVVDRDVEIIGIVNIGNGAELTVKDGAVLTIPEATQLTVCQGAVLTVEAGGQVLHQGAFLSNDGVVRISDDGDYAGYVRDSELYFGQTVQGINVDSVTGIPKENISLAVYCETEDQVSYILGIYEDYFEVQIFLTEDMTLHTMTIPEKVRLFIKDGITVTAEEFLTVNGYLGVHSAKLIVNGTLINNNNINPDYGSVIVNGSGSFKNNSPLFLNRGAELTIDGTMDSYAPVHVGFEHNEDGITVGTLTINGVMNNYDYLNICADGYVAEENRYTGGVVNVYGTLNNLDDDGFGFIEHHGELNIDGSLYNKNVIVLYGDTTVNGTLTNYYDRKIEVYGNVTINGTLDNSGSFWMYGSANVIANSGSVFGNYASVRNGGTGTLSILGEIWGSGEVVQDYFENGTVATVNGLENSRITLCYEGADEGAVLSATDYATDNGYMNYAIRVTGDLTISENTLLRIEENGTMAVMNNGDNFQGSLTVYGDIVNLGHMNIFAADVTIQRGGSIYNKNNLIVRDINYGVQRTPTITVNGILENESTGIMDLSAAKYVLGETGKIQNNWVDGQLGELYGVEIADQTLWTNIHDTTSVSGQTQLMTTINKVKSDGYRHGIVFVVTDTNMYSDMVVPEFVTVQVANGATLTVDEGVVLQTDSYLTIMDGSLVVDGILGAMAGMVNVNNGTMVVNGEFHEGETTVVNIAEGATLTINGNFGVDAGTLNVYGDCDNNGTMSATWTEEKVGTVNGYHNYELYMPINDYFPGHDENDMLDMIVYAEEQSIEKTRVHFFRDYKFSNNFVVPENMTFTIGAYPAMAATVTVPAGKTLMVNGNLEVAKESKLVIEEGAELIFNGENMGVYGTLENNGTLTLDRGSVEFAPETYVHGENAVVYTEKYDDGEYLNVNGIRDYETLVFRGNDEDLLLAMFREVSNDGYSLGEAYITGDMTMNSKHWYVEPSSWEEGDTFDVDVYVDGCTLTIPADKECNINTSLYVQNGGQVNIDGYLGLHTDMLIMDGGTVTVEGAISTGTVYVYTGGKLIVNGLWYGYNPINMGGTIVGAIFQQMTQTQVEQLLNDTGYVVLRSSMTLTGDMTIEEGQTLHVTNEGYVLTVPAGKTLTVDGVLLLTQGAKLDIKGTLIVNGEVRVVGSDMTNTGTVTNNGSVLIADGSVLLNKGTWNGNPATIDGGTVAMSQEILEAQLKASGEATLDTQVTLEKNMTITGQLRLADGGELIVPEGITLTNKGGITVDFGGKLDVDGKLLNYGSIIANDYFAEEACVSVAAYTHYTNASVAITCADMGCAKVEGIDTKYQTILGNGSTAEIANDVFAMLVDRGYQDAMVFLYGQWDNETGEMLPGTVDGNIYVPANGALIINNDQYITLNGNIIVDGLLGVSNAATLEVAAGSKISLSSTGAIEIQGTGRIIGEGMIDAQLNQINLPNQVECQIGYYATASNMTELLNAITAGLPEIHVIADFALTKGMTVPSDVTIVIEQGVTLTVNTTGAIVNNGEIIVDGKLVWVKGTLSGKRIILGETGVAENLPEGSYYVPGTVVQSFDFTTDADYGIGTNVIPVQMTVELYAKDILPVDAEDFRYVAEITSGDNATLVWNEETERYLLSATDTGAVTVTATAMDENGNSIVDESGVEITDEIRIAFTHAETYIKYSGFIFNNENGRGIYSGSNLNLWVEGFVRADYDLAPDTVFLDDREIIWELDAGDEAYATLKSNGTDAVLTAKTVTERQVVTVRARTADGVFIAPPHDFGIVKAVILPKVTKLALSVDGTDVTAKTIKHNLNNGNLKLDLSVTPAAADCGTGFITWTSSDETIATVDENGLVTFTGEEKNVVITAKANDGSGKTATVTITPVNMASYLYSYEENLTDLTGGQSATYYVCSDLTDDPANNTTYMNPNVIEWYLSDAEGNAITSHPYASITAAGKLTTKAVENTSTAYLMARLKDDTNITLDHPVEVTIHPTITKIEIQDQSGAVLITDIFDYETMGTDYNNFQLRTYPYDAVLKEIQWKSSNVNIAGFLDENGVLQASTTQTISNVEATSSDIVDLVAAGNNVAGTVTITATAVTHNNTKKTATFKITYGVFTKDIVLTDVDGATIYEPIVVRSGESYTIQANAVAYDPDNWTPTNTAVTWAVDNTTAASISNGKLTAKTVYNPENVTVTVASKDGACTVTRNVVVLPSNKTGEALVLKLDDENVTKATKSFDAGMGFTLTAFTVDETAAENGYLTKETGITWKSGNTNVATVNENGNVSVIGNGTAVITATASDGRTAQMTVKGTKVSQFVEITSATGSNVVASGKTLALKATVTYTSGTPDSAVIWSVDDTSAAKVSTSGVVTATANLMETTSVTVTATPKDGMADPATFEVIIVPLATGVQIFSAWDDCYPVDGIKLPAGEVLNNTTLTWDMNAAGNETMVLNAAVLPDDAMQGVTWTSSSAAIASFADKTVGELTFHKAGTVTITATANDGSGKKATFKIVVVKQMTDLYFDESLTGFQDYVLGGKSLAMSKFVTYGPIDVTNKKLAWEIVGGCDYATINVSTGALSTKAVTVPYEITVRVSSTDGSLNKYGETLYAEMTVTIYPATTKVNIYHEDLDITSKTVSAFVGDTLWLEAQSTPVESMMYYEKAGWQWTSSAADYVSIDETTGMATILKGGKTVTITAKAMDGTNKTATFKITTLQPVENITFQNQVIASGKQLQMAKLVTFEQEIQPTNTKLAWEIIEGSEYATINATTGVLTAGKVSLNKTVAVKATATDGSGEVGYCMVEIWPATTKLQIMDETNTDQTGKTIQVYLDAEEPEKTLSFTALATPGTALQENNVTWSVPAATAGYVDVDPETGVVTAKQGGKTVTVTAKAKDGSGKTATVRIQVIQLMTDMTVNNQPVGNELHFAKGKSTTLKVTAYPTTTANKNVTWSIVGGDGAEHITLSATGALKVLNTVTEKTSVTIRATAKDIGGYSEEFTLWLYPTLTTSVSVTAETARVQVGCKLPLTAQSLPYAEADENSSAAQAWIWSTSSAAIATVDGNGVVTGVKAGTATITCKAVDGSGRSATFKVTVVNPE